MSISDKTPRYKCPQIKEKQEKETKLDEKFSDMNRNIRIGKIYYDIPFMEVRNFKERYERNRPENEKLTLIARKIEDMEPNEMWTIIADAKMHLDIKIGDLFISKHNMMIEFNKIIKSLGYSDAGDYILMATNANDERFSKKSQDAMSKIANDKMLCHGNRESQDFLIYIPPKIRKIYDKSKDFYEVINDSRLRIRMDNKLIIRHMVEDQLVDQLTEKVSRKAKRIENQLEERNKILSTGIIVSNISFAIMTACALFNTFRQ